MTGPRTGSGKLSFRGERFPPGTLRERRGGEIKKSKEFSFYFNELLEKKREVKVKVEELVQLIYSRETENVRL